MRLERYEWDVVNLTPVAVPAELEQVIRIVVSKPHKYKRSEPGFASEVFCLGVPTDEIHSNWIAQQTLFSRIRPRNFY